MKKFILFVLFTTTTLFALPSLPTLLDDMDVNEAFEEGLYSLFLEDLQCEYEKHLLTHDVEKRLAAVTKKEKMKHLTRFSEKFGKTYLKLMEFQEEFSSILEEHGIGFEPSLGLPSEFKDSPLHKKYDKIAFIPMIFYFGGAPSSICIVGFEYGLPLDTVMAHAFADFIENEDNLKEMQEGNQKLKAALPFISPLLREFAIKNWVARKLGSTDSELSNIIWTSVSKQLDGHISCAEDEMIEIGEALLCGLDHYKDFLLYLNQVETKPSSDTYGKIVAPFLKKHKKLLDCAWYNELQNERFFYLED